MGALKFICAIIACGLIVAALNLWNSRKDKKEKEQHAMPGQDGAANAVTTAATYESKNETKVMMEATKGTRDLFMETLTNIGCQYELAEKEDDNSIFFAYQGEHFFADVTNENWYVHVWDTFWHQVELYDIDELTRLKKAVNEANLNCATITVYTINDAAKTVDVHCKSTFPLIPQMPHLENYLRGELNDFFRAHQLVSKEIDKLREQDSAFETKD